MLQAAICLIMMLPAQVVDVCRAANPRLIIKRARFSALVHNDLSRAVQNLVAPDQNASSAVDARQEIDLRIGASFTRFQTLLLQARAFDTGHFSACGSAANLCTCATSTSARNSSGL